MHASIEKHKCRGCYKDRSLYTNQMPVSLYTCFRDREESSQCDWNMNEMSVCVQRSRCQCVCETVSITILSSSAVYVHIHVRVCT